MREIDFKQLSTISERVLHVRTLVPESDPCELPQLQHALSMSRGNECLTRFSPLAAERASMDLTADAIKSVESSVDVCVAKLKPLIQASIEQDPTLAEAFLAEDRSKPERAKVALHIEKGSDDVTELNALKDSLTKIAKQGDEGQIPPSCI